MAITRTVLTGPAKQDEILDQMYIKKNEGEASGGKEKEATT